MFGSYEYISEWKCFVANWNPNKKLMPNMINQMRRNEKKNTRMQIFKSTHVLESCVLSAYNIEIMHGHRVSKNIFEGQRYHHHLLSASATFRLSKSWTFQIGYVTVHTNRIAEYRAQRRIIRDCTLPIPIYSYTNANSNVFGATKSWIDRPHMSTSAQAHT